MELYWLKLKFPNICVKDHNIYSIYEYILENVEKASQILFHMVDTFSKMRNKAHDWNDLKKYS